jgi:predicted RNA-binding protein Jag
MEWVETTGRTVAEAKDAALDQLGVDDADAEFVVVNEPRAGLFGRMRGEARVRARVRPTSPRPKRGRTRRPAQEQRGVTTEDVEVRSGSGPKATSVVDVPSAEADGTLVERDTLPKTDPEGKAPSTKSEARITRWRRPLGSADPRGQRPLVELGKVGGDRNGE